MRLRYGDLETELIAVIVDLQFAGYVLVSYLTRKILWTCLCYVVLALLSYNTMHLSCYLRDRVPVETVLFKQREAARVRTAILPCAGKTHSKILRMFFL